MWLSGKLPTSSGTQINDETWEDPEAMFIQADLGLETAEDIISNCRQVVRKEGFTKLSQLTLLPQNDPCWPFAGGLMSLFSQNRQLLSCLLGVNGSGENYHRRQAGILVSKAGKKVLLIAADTYRAKLLWSSWRFGVNGWTFPTIGQQNVIRVL